MVHWTWLIAFAVAGYIAGYIAGWYSCKWFIELGIKALMREWQIKKAGKQLKSKEKPDAKCTRI